MKKELLLLLTACTAVAPSVSAQNVASETSVVRTKEGQATTEVTGVVRSEATGLPIAGASVSVYGYPFATMTDDEGKFALKIPADLSHTDRVNNALSFWNSTYSPYRLRETGKSVVSSDESLAILCDLAVSAPGYAGAIYPLRGNSQIEVALLDESHKNLSNRQVLTPLGLREYSHVAAAVNVIDDDNSLSVKSAPEALLQGKVAGLNTQFRSGADGSGANQFLRGYNSIYATNQPLLVVDGMVIENAQFGMSLVEGYISTPLGCIDVRDIDKVTVLKDATSLYGVKGGNGAILIQTKHTTDVATHIDVTALFGMNMQPKKLPMLNATDSKRYLTSLMQSSDLTSSEVAALPWINDALPNRLPNGNYEHPDYYKYNQNTDWQDEIFQAGAKQQYTLSVTGGDEIAVYGVSMGFQNKDGVIKGTDYQRFNARVNAAIKFTDQFRLDGNMSFVYGVKNMANEGTASNINPIYSALVKAPFTAPRSISELGVASPAFAPVDALGYSNPSVICSDLVSENSYYRFMGNYNLVFDFTKNLSLSSNFGLDFSKEREVIFYPTTGIPYAPVANAEVVNQQMHGVQRLNTLFNETRLNYNKSFDRHLLDATLGYRFMNFAAESDYGHGYNSASNYYQTIGSGDAALYQNGGSLGNWRWMSWYGNVDYNYANRYFLQATASFDMSSRYGDNVAPVQVYPGVSAAWLMSSERWMRNASWLNLLKWRASYSLSGNDDIGNYNAKRYYISTAFLTNNGLVRGNLMNEDLKPERVAKANIGVDMAMFHNRLSLSLDAYQSKTKDLLIYSKAEAYTGFANYVSNGGELENKGLEATVNARVINAKNFSWDLGLTVAHNKNEVTALDCGTIDTYIGDGCVRTQVGSPIGIFYGYKTNGVYATTADAVADGKSTMIGAVKTPFAAGDVRFVDADNNGIIDAADRVKIGDPNADIFGGFSSVMKSHNFTLSAEFTYSLGNDVYNYTRSQLESQSALANQTKAVLNRWRSEGDVTSVPKATLGDPMQNSRFSDRWIEDGSFLKFKSLTLSYELPITNDYLTGITVYGTVENIYTFTDYKGYDPEIISSSSNNPLYQGVDAFTTPNTRTFYVGVKIGL